MNNLFSQFHEHIFRSSCLQMFFKIDALKVSLLSKLSKQCFVVGHCWLFSQNNQPTLDWKFKTDWTERLQKIPRKINVSLWMEFVQSIRWAHTFFHIPHKEEASFFFQVPYLEQDFMITNLVRLNSIFSKYWRRPRNILVFC